MSQLIIWREPSRILLGVDTITAGDGRLFEASKLRIIPHAMAVMAGRGSMGVLDTVAHLAMNTREADTFDALLALAPRLVRQAWDWIIAQAKAQFQQIPDSLRVHQELVLCGWSAARGEMVCMAFAIQPSGDVDSMEVDGAACGGWNDAAGPMPEPSSAMAMLGIANTVTAHARVTMPGYPVGGRLLVAELGADGVALSSHKITG